MVTIFWLVLLYSIAIKGQEFPSLAESFPNGTLPLSDEKRLTQRLLTILQTTGKEGRPVLNYSQSNSVKFGLGLIQISLDEKEKILITSMWSQLKWKDFYLRWNPGDYGNISQVRLEADRVWIPDIMLYNTADPKNAARNALVMVQYTGELTWVPHQIFKSSCSIDVTNFPFDKQKCHMWFGSWTHSRREIDIELSFPEGIDLSTFQSDYKDSSEWDIVNPEAEKRYLPAMSLFASFLVLLLILVEAAPPTASSVPTLGLYYCFNMVIIMVAICLSSLVVNIHQCGNQSYKKVPTWARKILLQCLARVLGIKCCSKCKPFQRRFARRDTNGYTRDFTECTNLLPKSTFKSASGDISTTSIYLLECQLGELRVTLNEILKRIRLREEERLDQMESFYQWKSVAKVLDRLFFIIYVGVIAVSLAVLFPKPMASHIFSSSQTTKTAAGNNTN
ncbi:DgyrCDS2007 [Dimorphilus gyrociliatus]|uniref:DgyrCDS2007 n=1 Tax=Dimorphilus gyrociliatus TaxID=2664684 RepID=A0A7I8VC42_9ANNE|nr:DgyrCDS2007 [Dimorphilus gyrociliatus]